MSCDGTVLCIRPVSTLACLHSVHGEFDDVLMHDLKDVCGSKLPMCLREGCAFVGPKASRAGQMTKAVGEPGEALVVEAYNNSGVRHPGYEV